MSVISSGAAVHVVVHLVAPKDCGDQTGATLRVSIEDVSMLDAPSVELASVASVLRGASQLEDPVDLLVTASPGRDYAVRAHVSRSPDLGHVSVGDLITVIRHPLDPSAGTAYVEIPLSTVRPSIDS